MELSPVPLEEGIYGGEWTAEKPGSYVAEIIAGREQEEIGPRRADLPPRRRRGRELPHLAEPRTAGEAFASRPAAGTTSRLKRPSCRMRFPIPKPASPRAKPATCGICRSSSCWPWASAPPNGCCAESGVWYEDVAGLVLLCLLRSCCPVRPRHHLLRHHLGPGRRAGLRRSASRCGPTISTGSLKKAGGDANVITLMRPRASRSAPASTNSPNRPSRPMPWC